MKTPVCFLLLLLLFTTACEKDNDDKQNGQSDAYINSFVSLTADKDSLLPGESTKIMAEVDGACISYAWDATQGDLLGSGSELTYIAQLCDCGKSRITCTAIAGSYTISRSLIIYIIIDE